MTRIAASAPRSRLDGEVSRVARGAFAAASIAALGACGGGAGPIGESGPPVAPAATAARLAWVQLEGCVVDAGYLPRTGTPVRALAADGRLLGNGLSDADGRFRLRAPVGATVTLAIDLPGGDRIPFTLGGADAVVETCLTDPRA